MSKLPPATLRALRILDQAEDKKLHHAEFRKACGVRGRAYYPFRSRLLDQRFISECYGSTSLYYELTFGGMSAIAKAEGR